MEEAITLLIDVQLKRSFATDAGEKDTTAISARGLAEVTGQKAVDAAYLDALIMKQNLSWMSALQLNNKKVRFKLDTGAEVTAISQEIHRLLGNPKLLRSTKI